MGNLPGSGIEPMSPALAGGFFTTEPPGKPAIQIFLISSKHPSALNDDTIHLTLCLFIIHFHSLTILNKPAVQFRLPRIHSEPPLHEVLGQALGLWGGQDRPGPHLHTSDLNSFLGCV